MATKKFVESNIRAKIIQKNYFEDHGIYTTEFRIEYSQGEEDRKELSFLCRFFPYNHDSLEFLEQMRNFVNSLGEITGATFSNMDFCGTSYILRGIFNPNIHGGNEHLVAIGHALKDLYYSIKYNKLAKAMTKDECLKWLAVKDD